MNATQMGARPAMTARLIHGSLLVSVILFALTDLFILKGSAANIDVPILPYVLAGISLASYAGSFLLLRRMIPLKNTDESSDLFWTRALTPALIAWAPLEGGALLGVVSHMVTGSQYGLGAAALGVLGLLALLPGRLEK